MRLSVLAGIWLLAWILPAFGSESLTVRTIERAPFSFESETGWDGFTIELLDEIADRNNWSLEYVKSENFGEMLAAVKGQSADIAAANISITSEREEELDFTQPFFDSGLVILVPEGGKGEIFSVLFSLDLMLWVGGAFILLMIAGVLIWLIETDPKERKQTGDNDYDDGKIGGPGEGIWWAVNVVTQAGFDIPSPKTRGGRFVAFSLILVGLFAVSAFVAQITAALTINELNSQVSGLRDLYGKRVGTTQGSTSSAFLQREGLRHSRYAALDELFDALEANELDAIVHDAPILAYYAQSEGKGRYSIVGRVFNAEKYGFAIPENHEIREALDRTLLILHEDGTYDSLKDKWFGDGF